MAGEVEVRVEARPDGSLPALQLGPGHRYRVVVSFPPVFRADTHALRFEISSCVLSPLKSDQSPWPTLASAVARHDAEGGRIVVLGHTSQTGTHSGNAALAERRAQTTAALLAHDEAGWVEIVSNEGSPADVQRWLQHWAHTHGWPTDPGRTDGVIDHATGDAVRAFQATYNQRFDGDVAEDGRITRATLAAVFVVCIAELEVNLRAVGCEGTRVRVAPDHVIGCGQDFADFSSPERMPESTTPPGQRRVDILVLPASCQWQPALGPQALVLYTEPTPIPRGPDTPRAREVRIRLVDHYGRPLTSEAYTLDAAGYSRPGVTGEDGLLVEADVPPGVLSIRLQGGSTVVFDPSYAAASVERGRTEPDPHHDPEPFEDYELPAPGGDANADLEELRLFEVDDEQDTLDG